MTKKRSDRLDPVVKLTDHREKSSAKELGKSRESHSHLEKRLEELLSYRQSYAEMLQKKAEQGIGSAEFCRYQEFLLQLDNAVEQQKNNIKQSSQTIQQKTTGWKNHRKKKQVMNKVASRIKKEELQIQEKQQQKESDDIASQAFSNTEKLF